MRGPMRALRRVIVLVQTGNCVMPGSEEFTVPILQEQTEYGSCVHTPAVGTIYGATPLPNMDTTPDYPANICLVVPNTFEPLSDAEVYRSSNKKIM